MRTGYARRCSIPTASGAIWKPPMPSWSRGMRAGSRPEASPFPLDIWKVSCRDGLSSKALHSLHYYNRRGPAPAHSRVFVMIQNSDCWVQTRIAINPAFTAGIARRVVCVEGVRMGIQIPADYRPSENEPFMNERQREYLPPQAQMAGRKKSCGKAARPSRIFRPRPCHMLIWPTVPRPRRSASWN